MIKLISTQRHWLHIHYFMKMNDPTSVNIVIKNLERQVRSPNIQRFILEWKIINVPTVINHLQRQLIWLHILEFIPVKCHLNVIFAIRNLDIQGLWKIIRKSMIRKIESFIFNCKHRLNKIIKNCLSDFFTFVIWFWILYWFQRIWNYKS